MKKMLFTFLLSPVFFLNGCSDNATTSADPPKTVTEVINAIPAPGAGAERQSGGYEPTKSERIPGITMSQEELDHMFAEARSSVSMPDIATPDTATEGAAH